jgi:hypothetical protein
VGNESGWSPARNGDGAVSAKPARPNGSLITNRNSWHDQCQGCRDRQLLPGFLFRQQTGGRSYTNIISNSGRGVNLAGQQSDVSSFRGGGSADNHQHQWVRPERPPINVRVRRLELGAEYRRASPATAPSGDQYRTHST